MTSSQRTSIQVALLAFAAVLLTSVASFADTYTLTARTEPQQTGVNGLPEGKSYCDLTSSDTLIVTATGAQLYFNRSANLAVPITVSGFGDGTGAYHATGKFRMQNSGTVVNLNGLVTLAGDTFIGSHDPVGNQGTLNFNNQITGSGGLITCIGTNGYVHLNNTSQTNLNNYQGNTQLGYPEMYNYNTYRPYAGVVYLDANEQIPDALTAGASATGNLILNSYTSNNQISKLYLGNHTETVNGLVSEDTGTALSIITGESGSKLTVGANNATAAYSGLLQGAMQLEKIGTGTQTLSGANTYTGATAINAGTLELTGAGTLGSGSITDNATLKLNYSADKTFANAISGTGTIIKEGTNKVNLNGKLWENNNNTNSFTGNMVINGGTLSVLMNGTNQKLNVNNLSGSGDLELRISNSAGNIEMASLHKDNFTGVISLVNNSCTDSSKFYINSNSYDGFTFRVGNGTTVYIEGNKELKGNVLLYGNGNSENRGALRVRGVISGNITVMDNANIAFDATPTVSGNISSGATSGIVTLYINGKTDGTTITSSHSTGTFTGVISDGTTGSKLGIYVVDNTQTFTAANTYSGGTTIAGGTLKINQVSGLGTGAVTINGGTLDASPAGKTKTFANGIVIGENGGAVTTATGDYSSFASISGSGDLTTNGFVHFNGTGGYNGHLTVNSGYTRINPGAFGVFDLTINNKSNFNVLNPGTIQIGKLNATTDTCLFGSSASNQYVFEIGAGTASSDTASYAGYIRGSSNQARNVTVKKVGAGTQTFCRTGYGTAGDTNSIKEVIVDGGKMVIDASHSVFKADSTTGFWGTAPITINAGGTLEYKKAWTTSPNIDLSINGGTLTLSNAEYLNRLIFNSGTVNGSGELRAGYVGSGVWEVQSGTSTINNNIAIAKNGSYTTFTVNFAKDAALELKKNILGLSSHPGTDVLFNGTGAGPGNISFNSNAGVATALGTVTFNNMNASIAGGNSWLDNGYFGGSAVTVKDSTLTTSRDHSFNGTNLTLDHGTLTANGAVNTYIYNLYLKNGSTVNGTSANSQFRTGHEWNSQFYTQYVDGTPENVMNEISADIAMFNTGRTMTFNIADKAPLTFSGSFVPAADGHYNALVKTGAGTMTLTGQNSHGTTTVSEGKLVLSGNGTFGSGAVTNNATLEFAHTSDQTVTNSISGTGSVIKSGTGDLTLTQAPGYTGSTTVDAGTLILSAGGTLYNLSGAGDVSYGENALTVSNSANTTFSGELSGSGAFTKAGTGTLTLSNTPAYTGATKVEAGTLALSEGGTLKNLSGGSLDDNGNVVAFIDASGQNLTLTNDQMSKFIGSITATAITVNADAEAALKIYTGANGKVDAQSLTVSSGEFDLKGYMTGGITVDSGAVFSPGNSVGEATFGGGYVLSEGATLLIEQDATGMDKLTASSYDINPNAILELTVGAAIPGATYDIIFQKNGDTTVNFTGNQATDDYWNSLLSPESAYYWNLSVKNNVVTAMLDANAVPEPSTWALLVLGAAGLLYWRRRK